MAGILGGCATPPETSSGPLEKDPSGMEVQHKYLGENRHLLTVTDPRPELVQKGGDKEAMTVVARRYATAHSPRGFEMVPTVEVEKNPQPFAPTTKSFIYTTR